MNHSGNPSAVCACSESYRINEEHRLRCNTEIARTRHRQSLPEPPDHALKLEFGDGQFNATFVCPETGCTPSYTCGQCGREIADAETKRCYDCPTEPAACWLKSWEADGVINGCVTGVVTVPITSEWNGEYPVVKIAEAKPVDLDALLREVHNKATAGTILIVSSGLSFTVVWNAVGINPATGNHHRSLSRPTLESALRAVLAEVEETNGSS